MDNLEIQTTLEHKTQNEDKQSEKEKLKERKVKRWATGTPSRSIHLESLQMLLSYYNVTTGYVLVTGYHGPANGAAQQVSM